MAPVRLSKSSICTGLLCGRIIWLEKARDTVGRLSRDDKNPDSDIPTPPLCGLTIIQGLEPAGLGHWNSGSLYNPEDGQTYRVSADLRSADMFSRGYICLAAVRRDQDPAAGSAAQVGRMVLAPLEP